MKSFCVGEYHITNHNNLQMYCYEKGLGLLVSKSSFYSRNRFVVNHVLQNPDLLNIVASFAYESEHTFVKCVRDYLHQISLIDGLEDGKVRIITQLYIYLNKCYNCCKGFSTPKFLEASINKIPELDDALVSHNRWYYLNPTIVSECRQIFVTYMKSLRHSLYYPPLKKECKKMIRLYGSKAAGMRAEAGTGAESKKKHTYFLRPRRPVNYRV